MKIIFYYLKKGEEEKETAGTDNPPEFSREGLCLKPEATHRGTMLGSNDLLHWRFMLPLSHYPFRFPPALERTGTAFSHYH